jgi:hypothetical protein
MTFEDETTDERMNIWDKMRTIVVGSKKPVIDFIKSSVEHY